MASNISSGNTIELGSAGSLDNAISFSSRLQKEKKKIILVGGCFDILHIGHISFLKKARALGDVLFVLLESDATIQKLKGKNRPINAQKDRAFVLSCLRFVDFVVLLKPHVTNNGYDAIIQGIRPTIIATTKGDPGRHHKMRQAKLIHAKVVDVIKRVSDSSTTHIAKLLSQDL